MKRTLSIFWFFLSFHWTVLLISCLGAILIVPGFLLFVISSAPDAGILAGIGATFLLVSGIWSPMAFRQLVGSRRLAMAPMFREFAVAALCLVAIVAGLLTWAFQLADRADVPDAANLALGAFAIFSVYLLVQQWACKTWLGVVSHLLVFMLAVRLFWLSNFDLVFVHSWALALGAALGWLWLWLAMRRQGEVAGPSPALRLERWGMYGNSWGWDWLPHFGKPAAANGSLVRGANDGLINRIGGTLVRTLGFASIWLMMMYSIRNPMVQSSRGPDPVLLVLVVSFFSVGMTTPLALAEWPVRMRYLWLRSSGDRHTHWGWLERELGKEVSIIIAITSLVAVTFLGLSETAPTLLLAYVVGSAVFVLCGCYFGFAIRCGSGSVNDFGFALTVIWIVLNWIGIWLYTAYRPTALFALIAFVGALAIGCRHLARRKFLAMDWCAVRPTRKKR